MCVCVCERERKRECLCVRVCVCVRERECEREASCFTGRDLFLRRVRLACELKSVGGMNRGTSPMRIRPSPQDPPRTLGIVLR